MGYCQTGLTFLMAPLRSARAAQETASPEVLRQYQALPGTPGQFLAGVVQCLKRDFVEQYEFTERLYHDRKGHQKGSKGDVLDLLT